MFRRIEYLNRAVGMKPHVVLVQYKSAASLGEMMEFADRVSATRGAAGYRLHDLHTDEVTEIWGA